MKKNKGYICKHCKKWHKFNEWHYAHWHGFNHVCDCGARTGIEYGVVVFVEKPE